MLGAGGATAAHPAATSEKAARPRRCRSMSPPFVVVLCTNKKALARRAFLFYGSLALTYFRAVYLALSSALPRFTVLFGMGRRGSRALWAPDIACRLVDLATKPIERSGLGLLSVTLAFSKVIGSSRTGN